MTQHASDAIVLRTWPVNEADLVVSFFTRDYGKVKGVAKAALRSRKRFGGALEPMTRARAFFVERPGQELVRLDQMEIASSPLSTSVDYPRVAVLSFYAEILEEALPEHDPQEAAFRLLLAVLDATTMQNPWMPLSYFSLWMTRLMGWLPDLAVCTACGDPLLPDATSFYSDYDGLFCDAHGTGTSSALSGDSWLLARKMLRQPVTAFAAEPWPRRRAADLRRFCWQALERHLERRMRTTHALRQLGA